jgi:hypothetical protein
MVLAGAIEALVLRAIEAERLFFGALGAMIEPSPLGKQHQAAVLADAFPGIDRAVGAIALPIAIPARRHPILALFRPTYIICRAYKYNAGHPNKLNFTGDNAGIYV